MPLPSPDGDLHPGGCFFCGLVGYWPTVHGELYHLAKVLVFYFEFSRIVANGVPSHSVSSSNSKWAQPTCSLFVIVFSRSSNSHQGVVVDDAYVSFVSSWNILPFILECADLQANLLSSMSWQLWGECCTYTPLLVPTRVWFVGQHLETWWCGPQRSSYYKLWMHVSRMHQSPPRKLCLNEGTGKPSIGLSNVEVYNHIFMNPIVPESLIRLLDNNIHDEHPKISSIETIPFA